MVRMTQAASRRRRGEWVMLAQVIAAGVGAGFSGNWKPIQALARSLNIPVHGGSGPREVRDAEVGDLVTRLHARLGRGHGGRSHSR
jgi:hypothetical protein